MEPMLTREETIVTIIAAGYAAKGLNPATIQSQVPELFDLAHTITDPARNQPDFSTIVSGDVTPQPETQEGVGQNDFEAA